MKRLAPHRFITSVAQLCLFLTPCFSLTHIHSHSRWLGVGVQQKQGVEGWGTDKYTKIPRIFSPKAVLS
jgi:hypothetical protein